VLLLLNECLLLFMSLSTQSGTFWIHPRMIAFYCVVLSCVGRGLAMGRSVCPEVLPKCLNGFTVSEVNSETDQGEEA
jgi:hypothetical protein